MHSQFSTLYQKSCEKNLKVLPISITSLKFKSFLKLFFFISLNILFFEKYAFSNSDLSRVRQTKENQKINSPFRVYVYDSWLAEAGMGPIVKREFEKKCEVPIKWISVSDSGQLLSRIKLDSTQGKWGADAALGVDQILWKRVSHLIAKEKAKGVTNESLGSKYRPKIRKDLWVDDRFLPFDYGIYSLMWNPSYGHEKITVVKTLLETPKSIRDLLEPKWKRKILFQDPRTSAPGLGFLLHVREVISEKKDRIEYFKKLKNQWLTVTAGWDESYGLFLKGIAPLVWSYASSEAYHNIKGQNYNAVPLDQIGIVQIEGLVNLTDDRIHLNNCFADLLLSVEMQKEIPYRNWMMPVLQTLSIEKFKAYDKISLPKRLIYPQLSPAEYVTLLSEWEGIR